MSNVHVQRVIERFAGESMKRKGSALRAEIRKAPAENRDAAWTVYALLLAAERYRPDKTDACAYAAWREAHDVVMNVLGRLLWPDGLDPHGVFTQHLAPKRRREVFQRLHVRGLDERAASHPKMREASM